MYTIVIRVLYAYVEYSIHSQSLHIHIFETLSAILIPRPLDTAS